MQNVNRCLTLFTAILASVALTINPPVSVAFSDEESVKTEFRYDARSAPISDLLRALPEDVRIYNQHITTLADPFLGGRLPATYGMEVAKKYMIYYFQEYGLEPAFPANEYDSGGQEAGTPFSSWLQPFPLGNETKVTQQGMQVSASPSLDLRADRDFLATGMGGSGQISAPATFIGYSIESGPDEYSSFDADDDLTGRIAIMFRFEPMDDEGNSLWSTRGPWSGAASYRGKVRSAASRNPAAIIIISPPGVNDPRADQLQPVSGSFADVPVLQMTASAGERLIKALDATAPSLIELRQMSDQGRAIVPFDGELQLDVTIERVPTVAKNVGGVLHGRGDLADEWVVVGGHLDHIGFGYFGSRSGSVGELHPGADDNASGSAGILLLAKLLSESYQQLPPGASARSVIFMGFSAEESGLNGSRYYADNPIVDIDKHVLMMNYDMIGRVENGRLSVSGGNTGEGFAEWLAPYFDASPLTIIQPERMSGASDHTSFMRRQIPVLFAIIADFHDDYHTPNDVVDKINRVGAVETVKLFHQIALDFVQLPQAFSFVDARAAQQRPAQAQGPGLSDIKIRFGVVPATYDDDPEAGIPVRSVTEGGSAAEAGIKAGDRLVEWNGKAIESMLAWMAMMAEHEPGDIVVVTVMREGQRQDIKVTLQARADAAGG